MSSSEWYKYSIFKNYYSVPFCLQTSFIPMIQGQWIREQHFVSCCCKHYTSKWYCNKVLGRDHPNQHLVRRFVNMWWFFACLFLWNTCVPGISRDQRAQGFSPGGLAVYMGCRLQILQDACSWVTELQAGQDSAELQYFAAIITPALEQCAGKTNKKNPPECRTSLWMHCLLPVEAKKL